MNKKYLSLLLSVCLLPMTTLTVNANDLLLPIWDGWWVGNTSISRLTHPGPSEKPYGTRLNTRFALEGDEKMGEATWNVGMIFQLGDTNRIKSDLELILYHTTYASGHERYIEVYASTITWDHEIGATLDELELEGLFEYVEDKNAYKVNVDNKNTIKVWREQLLHFVQDDPFIVDSPELNKFLKKNKGKKISIIISGDHAGASFYSTNSSNPEEFYPGLQIVKPSSSEKNVFQQMIKKSDEIRIEE